VDVDRWTASQALRRFALGSGPLKRTSDQLQFLARVLLVCSLVTAIPVALVVASVVHVQALTEATAQSLERHQVDAELVADPPILTSVGADVPQTPRATAVWPGPSGREHTGLVAVPTGARAGSTVPIWIDRDGDLTTRPLDSGGAVARAAGMAAGTYLLISALAVTVYLAFLAALDRSRLRRWAAEWAVTEPVWTGTVP
jgi:hypothetical protein